MNFYSSVSDFQPKKEEIKGNGLMLAVARICKWESCWKFQESLSSRTFINFAAETNEFKISQRRKMFELSNVLNVQMLYFYQFVFWTFYIKSDRIQAME